MLEDLTTEDIQTFYTYEMNGRGVSANTAIHYHANIRKALQYAVKREWILSNPADLVERTKKTSYVTSFFNAKVSDGFVTMISAQLCKLIIS